MKLDYAYTSVAFARSFLLAALLTASVVPVAAATRLSGQVLGGGSPIAGATVTVWEAGPGAPRRLAQGRTGQDGRFDVSSSADTSRDGSIYVIARGGRSTSARSDADNPSIALITILGGNPPGNVTINEMTTIASVWTHNQFINSDGVMG